MSQPRPSTKIVHIHYGDEHYEEGTPTTTLCGRVRTLVTGSDLPVCPTCFKAYTSIKRAEEQILAVLTLQSAAQIKLNLGGKR